MSVDFAGAAVGTAFGELFSLVKEVVQTIAVFPEQLKKIESTLDSIVPIMKNIDEFNRRMDRKDMRQIQALINGGKDLVNKCLKVKAHNLCKRYSYSKKLTKFDTALAREFQLSMPLLAVRNTVEILGEVKDFREEFRLFTSRIANDGSLQSGLGPSGNLAVPEAPDFVVGSEVEVSLRELKERLLKEGVSMIVVTAPGGCGKTTLLTKLCHEAEIKVNRCKGLPLALTVIAKSLRGKDPSFWETKLLDWSERRSLLHSDNDVLDCLKKSLDDLDGDPSIKERFMDLSSFPEDRKIPATALIDMWVELYKLDFSGVRAIADLNKLVYRNLADLVVTRDLSEDDEDKCYSSHYAMQHDLLRELAILECNQGEVENRERLILDLTGNNFPDWWSEQKQPTLSARLVSISTDGTFSASWPNLQLPKAEALVLNFGTAIQTKTYALPEFIEKADNLKALIVTNYSFFPAELRNFHVIGSNLRRMRFERVTVPFLSMRKLRLHSLQKISFFMCSISQASASDDAKISEAMPKLVELHIDYCNDLMSLPNDICEIKLMKKLSITNCHNLSALPDQIGQLASLEVVRFNSCTNLLQLPNSIGNLRKLISLNIFDCLSLSTLPNEIGQLVNLKRMNMRGCLRLSELPRSIVKLRNLSKVVCDKEKEDLWRPLRSTLNSLNIVASEEEEANLDWLND
ncbi:hypothetical protein BT93_G0833 [Corymbia citriodora subsp. variegata]|nr:hypothetical protein BT93_G0833 [Corymbia citriodora subsp. variegata]